MKLVIMRHCDAQSGTDDYTRQLTPQGRQDADRMAALLSGCGWDIRHIQHSPLHRTTETAEIIQAHLHKKNVSVEREPAAALAPGLDVDDAMDILMGADNSECRLWIFHAPDVARMGSYLTGLPESAFYFPPGTMLALNLPLPHPRHRSMLIWHMQPDYLPGSKS